MRKTVKILEEIRWRKNEIADEQERIELEFGSDHGPERQRQEEQLAKLIDEAASLNNLFISYAKINKTRKENKSLNAWARRQILSKDDRREYIRDARMFARQFFISELNQLN